MTSKSSGITSLFVGEKMKKQMKHEAKMQGLSCSAFIRQLFTAWLQFKEEKEQD